MRRIGLYGKRRGSYFTDVCVIGDEREREREREEMVVCELTTGCLIEALLSH